MAVNMTNIETLLLRGLKANLPSGSSIVDGALYFCTDTLEIYEGYTTEGSTLALRRYGGLLTAEYVNDQSVGYVAGATTLPVPTTQTEGMVCYATKDNLLVASVGGQWVQLNYGIFGGATADTAGSVGLVPAPVAGAVKKYLKSNGEWATVDGSEVTLTQYAVPETASEVTTDDTVDVAFGKIVKKMDDIVSAGGEPNQNAFSKVGVGETTIEAGSKTDTVKFAAEGDHIEVTADAESKTVKITHATQAGVTAGEYGASEATLDWESNREINVPAVTVDAAGHVTAVSTVKYALPELPAQTDYTVTMAQDGLKYTLTQNGAEIGVIDIPKDMVVESGALVTFETDTEVNGSTIAAGTYIELTIANKDANKIYINVKDLVDAYTAAQGATQVQLAISATNEISATIVAGSIGTTELADDSVTNAKFANMPAFTVKANNTNAEADPADVAAVDLVLNGFAADETATGDVAATDTLGAALNKLANAIAAAKDQADLDYVAKKDFTAEGDILVGTGAGAYEALAKGTAGQVLKTTGNGVEWADEQTSTVVVANSATATENTAVDAEAGEVLYLNHVENGAVTASHVIQGAENIKISADANGAITIAQVWGTF